MMLKVSREMLDNIINRMLSRGNEIKLVDEQGDQLVVKIVPNGKEKYYALVLSGNYFRLEELRASTFDEALVEAAKKYKGTVYVATRVKKIKL